MPRCKGCEKLCKCCNLLQLCKCIWWTQMRMHSWCYVRLLHSFSYVYINTKHIAVSDAWASRTRSDRESVASSWGAGLASHGGPSRRRRRRRIVPHSKGSAAHEQRDLLQLRPVPIVYLRSESAILPAVWFHAAWRAKRLSFSAAVEIVEM